MNKRDLKKVIKPLVKECIHEVLLEEGLLSNIVSEVAAGMQGNLVVETQKNTPKPLFNENADEQIINKRVSQLKEQKKRMLDAIGKDAFNGVDLFEGTTPAPAQAEAAAGAVDMGSPSDAGVDITSIMGGASKIWKAMK